MSSRKRAPDEANCPNCGQATDRKRKEGDVPFIHFTQFLCWNNNCSVDIFSVQHTDSPREADSGE